MKKQVLVSADRRETRVAILEATAEEVAKSETDAKDGASDRRSKAWRLAEYYIERRGDRSIVGNVYKAKVDNVVAGLEAAFVDIGREKNGFLHVDDIVVDGQSQDRRSRGRSGSRISDLLKSGQEIVVQVTKDPLKTKGARLTMQLSIAGRYMVYIPQGEGLGFSRRLDDRERDRLRREAAKLTIEHGGAIVRTAAHGAKLPDFERELIYLDKLYEVLQRRVEQATAPSLVFQEADLAVRVLRDVSSDQFERAVIDSKDQKQRVASFLERTAPDLVDRVELFRGKHSLFESYGIDKEIEKLLARRVDLPSGGYLVIDATEALTVIDVNTGSFTGRGKSRGLEDTITKTNLEAADEVVRQIRLRDIGGIIVIDFIDMARASNRDAVLKTLRSALDEDRTKTHVVEISPLGLVEMTRQNVTDGVREIMTKPCPACAGEGVVLDEETVAIDVERALEEYVAGQPKAEAYLVQVNPRVAAVLMSGGAASPAALLEAETGKQFHFKGGEGLPLEHFAVTLEGTVAVVEDEALPFEPGDEVMVQLVEPHMYEDNAAVAKLDGYVIAVSDAIAHVGSKALVRIDKVGRGEASATMVGKPIPAKQAPVSTAAKNALETENEPKKEVSDGDGVESSTRSGQRRGRRGGRGRPRANTTSSKAKESE